MKKLNSRVSGLPGSAASLQGDLRRGGKSLRPHFLVCKTKAAVVITGTVCDHKCEGLQRGAGMRQPDDDGSES